MARPAVAAFGGVLERTYFVRGSRSEPVIPVVFGTRVRPARGGVTSPFGERRGGHRHPGVDIDGSTGDPVVAAAAGTVEIAGRAPAGYSGYGILVVIDHGGGVHSLYAHLSAVAVHAGQVVVPGQRVGSIGATGEATGSHLHFEVRRGSTPINPLQWLAGR